MKSERERACAGGRAEALEKKTFCRQMFPMELLKERRGAN